MDEFDKIKYEYLKTLTELSKGTGKTIEELDAEISEQIKNCQNIEDILIKSSEII
jgi:hypothetical protein